MEIVRILAFSGSFAEPEIESNFAQAVSPDRGIRIWEYKNFEGNPVCSYGQAGATRLTEDTLSPSAPPAPSKIPLADIR